MVAQNIAFGVIAALMVWGALRVVTTKNVVHAALWLVLVLGGAAAQYVLLAAEFTAASQVLVYLGAVVVLFLFGTMLTRARLGRAEDLTNRQWPLGLGVALLLFGTLAYVQIEGFEDRELDDLTPTRPIQTAEVADQMFGPYLVPFLAISSILLAALVGAIVLARRD